MKQYHNSNGKLYDGNSQSNKSGLPHPNQYYLRNEKCGKIVKKNPVADIFHRHIDIGKATTIHFCGYAYVTRSTQHSINMSWAQIEILNATLPSIWAMTYGGIARKGNENGYNFSHFLKSKRKRVYNTAFFFHCNFSK